MARRAPAKSQTAPPGAAESSALTRSTSAPKARTASGNAATRPSTPQQRIDHLERELEDTRRRIDDLEARQRQIADRIAWALDSLRDLMDDDG